MSPIIAILHNQKENRWHPIIFEYRPGTGSVLLAQYMPQEYYTVGFATRAEAINYIHSDLIEGEIFESVAVKTQLSEDIEWDGGDIPAMTIFDPEGYIYKKTR